MEKPKIGIALSGGGAKGIAHIGVLKALLENGIEPDLISGTSAGAIAGALYAAGYKPAEMLEFVKDASIFKIFKVVLPNDGLTKLTYLRNQLTKYIPDKEMENLHKELFVVLANLNTGMAETWSKGNIYDVVMASSSIPLVFKPVEINGNLYVDGGLLNNLPVEPLVGKADFIIGVNVMPHITVEGKYVQNLIGIATRCFELSIHANTKPSTTYCDVLIAPNAIHSYSIFNFNKHQELFEAGYQEGLRKVLTIKKMIREITE